MYKAERSFAVRFFFDRRKLLQAGNNYILRGRYSSFSFLLLRSHCVCGAVPSCAFSFSYIWKEENKYVRTYMQAASGLFSWMEHGALGICESHVCTYLFGPSVPFHSSS